MALVPQLEAGEKVFMQVFLACPHNLGENPIGWGFLAEKGLFHELVISSLLSKKIGKSYLAERLVLGSQLPS